jgi:hypothetical protein
MVTLLNIADAARTYHNHDDSPHDCAHFGDASHGCGDIVHGVCLPILYGDIAHDISASDVGDAALYYSDSAHEFGDTDRVYGERIHTTGWYTRDYGADV